MDDFKEREKYEKDGIKMLAEAEKATDELLGVSLYIEAANFFRLAKNWSKAGESFLKAIEQQQQMDDPRLKAFHQLSIATNYAEAGMCFKKADLQKAIDCYLRRVDIYIEMEQYYLAATEYFTIADLHEREPIELDRIYYSTPKIYWWNENHKTRKELAGLYYDLAADFYDQAKEKSFARECRLKVAMISAELEKYEKAAMLFREIAFTERHPLFKTLFIKHLFYFLLCNFCMGADKAKHELQSHRQYLEDTPEFKFFEEIFRVIEDQTNIYMNERIQQYLIGQVVKKYCVDHLLDEWELILLDRIKNFKL